MRRWEHRSEREVVLKGHPQLTLERNRQTGEWELVSYDLQIYVPEVLGEDLDTAKTVAVEHARAVLTRRRTEIDLLLLELNNVERDPDAAVQT